MDIVNDDISLSKFNYNDIIALCYYSFVDESIPKYKIISSESEIIKKKTIKLMIDSDKIIEKRIDDFVIDSPTLEQISSLDLYRFSILIKNNT